MLTGLRRLGLAGLVVVGAAAMASQALAAAPGDCTKLVHLTAPQLDVTGADVEPANAFLAPGEKKPFDTPAFCRVQARAHPSPDSDIRIEVWLPLEGWNGKFEGVGTGGYLGVVSYRALADGLKRGYVVASTDMGHTGDDLAFGRGHPEKVRDWAYRAIHVTAEAGKLITRDYQGRFPSRSYFVGCATGGHQALSEAQRYPEDYDGIIAGDPAYSRLHETAAYVWAWEALHDATGKPLLSHEDLKLVTKSAIADCDGADGVKDGVIDDPRRCRFVPERLTCKDGATTACLTPGQVAGVKAVYAGPRNPRTGAEIFPGWPVGSEGYGDRPSDGWGAFLLDPKQPMRSEVYSDFLFDDPNWNFRSLDFDRDLAYADQNLAYLAATDEDLTPFARRGGRLILYTGWADPVLPAQDVIDYRDGVRKAMGPARADAFMAFYMVPGMGHCSGGPGPTRFDMMPALEAWVEHDAKPDVIAAAHVEDGVVQRTRKLCPYPQAGRWSGKGDPNDAANFTCQRETSQSTGAK